MSGTVENTTNQRMELLEACVALERIDGDVEVRSDSKYVVTCFTDRWWEKWLDRSPETGVGATSLTRTCGTACSISGSGGPTGTCCLRGSPATQVMPSTSA